VHLTNTGTAHVQVAKIDLALAQDGAALGSHTLAAYVLPGNTRSWVVKTTSPAALGAKVRIKSITDAGAFDLESALEVETAAETAESSAALTAAR
jgi:P pilus assembly chaperone PapD